MALSPGTPIGPYEVISLIGVGGIGEVYWARDPKLQRDVGRSADDPESETKFTGCKSHEPALRLWQQCQDVSRGIKAIRQQPHEAGIKAE